MPEKTTLRRVRRDREEGKAPTTQAGEFVREEMEHAKRGKHPVKGRKQAIAIGLSKARHAGVKIPPPPKKGSRSSGARASTPRSSGAKSRTGGSKPRTGSTSRTGTARSRPGGARSSSSRRSR